MAVFRLNEKDYFHIRESEILSLSPKLGRIPISSIMLVIVPEEVWGAWGLEGRRERAGGTGTAQEQERCECHALFTRQYAARVSMYLLEAC